MRYIRFSQPAFGPKFKTGLPEVLTIQAWTVGQPREVRNEKPMKTKNRNQHHIFLPPSKHCINKPFNVISTSTLTHSMPTQTAQTHVLSSTLTQVSDLPVGLYTGYGNLMFGDFNILYFPK
jgi:hypothetical protein